MTDTSTDAADHPPHPDCDTRTDPDTSEAKPSNGAPGEVPPEEGAPEAETADAPDMTAQAPDVTTGAPETEIQDHPSAVTPRESEPVNRDRASEPRSAGVPVRVRTLVIAAAATGGWAAVVSFAPVLVVVLLGWFGTTDVSGGTAVRFAVTGWLLAHGVPFAAPHGQVGLVPLGITALVVWRLVRAGAHTARAVATGPRDVPYVVGALGIGYGLIGGVAGYVASTGAFDSSPLRAFLTAGVLAAASSAPGALVETGAAGELWRRWPEPVREGLRGGAYAGLVVLAAGAALAGLATVMAYPDAVDLYHGYHAGIGGGAGITLVGLIYAPNLAIWGASYLVGPGFGFGVGTHVTLFDVSLGPLPAVPVLAGLPTGPAPTAVGVLLAVPVLAGIVAGVAAARRDPEREWRPLLGGAALTGPVAGVLLGLAAFASSGPLGSGQLAQVGPTWWSVALVTTLVVAAGATLAAGATRLLDAKR